MSYLARSKASLCVGASLFVLAVSVPALAKQTAQGGTESVIVTGTRVTGISAADSAAPITVVGGDTFNHVAAPNLMGALLPTLPSFDAEAHGGDTGTLMMTARLRGLNPNHTLVLVNGKRRHGTANLHVLPGAFQGAATTDLDMIALPAISRIEVLQDGAAAQYGSDAIAGVVNIILKRNESGGTFSATGGQYYRRDGDTYDFAGNIGFDLGGKGFLSITGEKRYRGFTQRSGPSTRVATSTGAPLNVPFDVTKTPDFPYAGNNIGDPESQLATVFYNAEYEVLPELTLYSFGSYGHRNAKSFGSYRAPNQAGFIALQFSNQQFLPPGSPNPGCGNGITPASGINTCYRVIPSGSYTTPGELIFSEAGFRPQIGLMEDDYSYTFGANGKLAGWNWDLSGTYGKDIDKLSGLQTGNGSLFVATHMSPSSFYLGSFRTSELTGNLDVNKTFDVGLASPLNVAFGFEARENTYAITPGSPDSYFGIGASNFPGFGPTSVLSRSRKNYSEYIDVAVSPIADLQLDIAGRHEHYTDFGDTTVGKITARYDFSPAFAIRGTAASGFRAPTLAEEYYTQTNVSTTSAIVTLGPNSVGAAAEGIPPLGPENSVNYSIGFVTHLWDNFSATVDFYSIAIGNRIVGTGDAPCKSNNVIVSVPVCNALVANGNVLDPSVVTTGTNVFTNSVSTITQGVDITANYHSDWDDWGTVNWTGAANWGETRISSFAPNPPALAGVPLQTPSSIANLTSLSPKFKFVLGALWNLDAWTLNLREVIYGPTRGFVTPGVGRTASFPVIYVANGANYYEFKTPTTGITDIDLSYAFTDHLSVTVGANNVFDVNPPVLGLQSNGQPLDGGSTYFSPQNQTPYGFNGGFYFGRVNITW
jgi:iron complex outermembrane receptor protein